MGSDCFVLGNTNQNHDRTGRPIVCRDKNHVRQQSQGVINDLDNVDFVPSNVRFFASRSFVVFVWRQRSSYQNDHKGKKSDNETCFQNPYIDTKNQLADILTKGNFTHDEWNHLLCSFNISHFRSAECSEVMSKRTQKRIKTGIEFIL